MVVDVIWCLVLLVWSLALRAPGAVVGGDDCWRFVFGLIGFFFSGFLNGFYFVL